MSKAKVAFVRGSALNPFETQVFSRLDGYEAQAVGAVPANYEVDLVPVPVTLLPTGLANARAARIARRLGLPVDSLLGPAGRLRGLREVVGDAQIIHAAETFIPLGEQCADIAADTGASLVLTCWENIAFRGDEDDAIAQRKQKLRAAAALFIAVTPRARDTLVAEGVAPERIRVIPAALDTDRFRPGVGDRFLAAKLGLPRSARIVLFIGRMIREKGVTELVQAFARIDRRGPDTHLVFVGNGPQLPRVKRAAAALGVAGCVHFLPGQSYQDVPRVFSSADVVVVPSLSTPYWQEQFGYVLVEAMAAARPVITTRSGSIPDVVGNAAILIEDYDIGALAAAMTDVLDDQELATSLRTAGRQRAEQLYASGVVAYQLADAYDNVLRQRR